MSAKDVATNQDLFYANEFYVAYLICGNNILWSEYSMGPIETSLATSQVNDQLFTWALGTEYSMGPSVNE